MKTNIVLHTNGKGLWSNVEREVKVYQLELGYLDDEDTPTFGELCVYFRKGSWNIKKHGLIYTDPTFMRELKKHLKSIGLSNGVEYSEQGMQGDDYVSCDVDEKFLRSWFKLEKGK